jgi:hypothetical protein
MNFVKESHTVESGADPLGLYQQTLESIAACTVFRHDDSRNFWVADKDGEVMAYAMTHVSKEVDNKLCYWATQAWVHPALRNTPLVKEMWNVLRNDAVESLAEHIIIPSSRGSRGYCRFLGKNWKPYVTLLKEDL